MLAISRDRSQDTSVNGSTISDLLRGFQGEDDGVQMRAAALRHATNESKPANILGH